MNKGILYCPGMKCNGYPGEEWRIVDAIALGLYTIHMSADEMLAGNGLSASARPLKKQ